MINLNTYHILSKYFKYKLNEEIIIVSQQVYTTNYLYLKL
jgi:hypothetical protein